LRQISDDKAQKLRHYLRVFLSSCFSMKKLSPFSPDSFPRALLVLRSTLHMLTLPDHMMKLPTRPPQSPGH
jgi:hypothetical protein